MKGDIGVGCSEFFGAFYDRCYRFLVPNMKVKLFYDENNFETAEVYLKDGRTCLINENGEDVSDEWLIHAGVPLARVQIVDDEYNKDRLN